MLYTMALLIGTRFSLNLKSEAAYTYSTNIVTLYHKVTIIDIFYNNNASIAHRTYSSLHRAVY